MIYRTGIGQDSHRFFSKKSDKPCIIGGLVFPEAPGMSADSDGDVVLHSICNAITSLTHIPILGELAVELCHKKGITDSSVYLRHALETLQMQKIVHVALTLEGKKPRLQKRIDEMRSHVSNLLSIQLNQVGITVTSGDELTAFGRGEGLQCFCILTTSQYTSSK